MAEVVFVVQNETHADNFVELAEGLESRGWPRDRVAVLHLDAATGLDTRPTSPWSRVLEVPAAAGGSFYRMGSIARARYLATAASPLRRSVADARVLVIGNDGALQRILGRDVRRRGGRVFMVLDGLLRADAESAVGRVRSMLKRTTYGWAESLGLEAFVPSEVGFMKTDRSFAMSEYVAEVLRSRRRGQRVDAIAMPRLVRQRERVISLKRAMGAPAARRFTYYTSAFRWHGDRVQDELQWRDLADVMAYAEQRPDERVAIRVHPREEHVRYEATPWPANVLLTDKRTPLEADLAASEYAVTARSTVAFEAWQIGLPVMLYERNFGPPARESVWSGELAGVARSTVLTWGDMLAAEPRPLPTMGSVELIGLIEDGTRRRT